MLRPKLTFIVSAFSRPDALRLCLQSLRLQTEPSWEAIVMDNSSDLVTCIKHQGACAIDDRIQHVQSPSGWNLDCYRSSEWAATRLARGEWLCFASDDSYYVPEFAERMLAATVSAPAPDIVYCDLVWGRDDTHTMLDCKPVRGFIDKTNFIIRRTVFRSWPNKPQASEPAHCDGYLVEGMVNSGTHAVKVPQLLVVHN